MKPPPVIVKQTRNEFSIERIISVSLIALLLIACMMIAAPFIGAIAWAIIIAVTVSPVHHWLAARLGGRSKISASIVVLVLFALFVVPIVLVSTSVVTVAPDLSDYIGELMDRPVAKPPAWITDLPIVGDSIKQSWRQFAHDSKGFMTKLRPNLQEGGLWLLGHGTTLLLAVLQFLIAIFIAAAFLISGDKPVKILQEFLRKIGNENTVALLGVATRTVRGVSVGVVGTALLQALVAAIGYAITGLPAIPLLGFITFLLAVMQLPTPIIWGPAVAWLWFDDHHGYAIFLFIWGSIVINAIDSIVRPYLISHGARLPMSLIFIGVLGGLVAWGFIGIFIGATVIGVAYKLLISWLNPDAEI